MEPNKKIAVAGATGLIGKKIVDALIGKGYDVVIIGRDVDKSKKIFPGCKLFSDYSLNYLDNLNNCEAFINLAGANVSGGRWSKEYKDLIMSSRINATKAIVNIIKQLKNKPKTLINASAIGYYGISETQTFTEQDGVGKDYLARVCELWEEEAKKVIQLGIRETSIRIGVVLSKEGGALKKMILPYYLFLGGPIGDGTQWLSWIHIDDLLNVFVKAIEDENMSGGINACSPNPVRMKHFSSSIGKVIKRPSFLFVPKFIIKIIMGEGAYIVTEGSRVIPEKLMKSDFVFEFPDLEKALKKELKD